MLRTLPAKPPKALGKAALPSVGARRRSSAHSGIPPEPGADATFALPLLESSKQTDKLLPAKSNGGLTGLTSAQLKALKRAFTWADANYDSSISVEELAELLIALGYNFSSQV